MLGSYSQYFLRQGSCRCVCKQNWLAPTPIRNGADDEGVTDPLVSSGKRSLLEITHDQVTERASALALVTARALFDGRHWIGQTRQLFRQLFASGCSLQHAISTKLQQRWARRWDTLAPIWWRKRCCLEGLCCRLQPRARLGSLGPSSRSSLIAESVLVRVSAAALPMEALDAQRDSCRYLTCGGEPPTSTATMRSIQARLNARSHLLMVCF